MLIDPKTGAAVPALSGSEILSRVHGIRSQARLSYEDYARLPGPHVTPSWMWRLKNHVANVLSDAHIDGVVITHGTDTMEETAFLHQLTLGDSRPVIFCGAMRTVSEPGWDGPASLLGAVRAAAHPSSRGRGVMITVGEDLHSAGEATKWHTHRVNGFNSPNGPLGFIDRDEIVYHRPPARSAPLISRRLVTDVDLHVMAAGVDGGLIRSSIDRGVRGLVVEATGVGNIPPPAVPAIVQCLVNFSFQISKKVSVWRTAPSMSVLNRRRRVGRQWIQAVLDGRVDAATLHWVAHTALPQLVGSGPDVHRGVAAGRDCFEYLRGAATARIMAEPDENLVPRATALHAMESVLVMHLGAFEQAVAESRLR